jgi:Cof subfamily protein (haloacid dehalogenase superfamily)
MNTGRQEKSGSVDIVITDLDGTLLDSHCTVQKQDHRIFNKLKSRGIYAVIATGRSFFSLKKVLPLHFPLDYLIFSCGAGIMEWPSKEIIFSSQLEPPQVAAIGNKLIAMNLDFMVQCPIPDNHKFSFYHSGRENPDFFRRIELYQKFAEPLTGNLEDFGPASQIIVISANGEYILPHIKASIKGISIVQTTSPLDHKTNWIEILSPGISKAHAARWLCDRLGISQSRSLAVGNDYNDLHLLKWAGISFVVENAPEEIKKQFNITSSNDKNGFSQAVKKVLEI